MSVAGACVRGVRVAFSKKKAGCLLLPTTGEPAEPACTVFGRL